MRSCPETGCGYTAADQKEQFCPDCGAALVNDDGASTSLSTPPPEITPVNTSSMPMPEVVADTRPVLFTLTCPDKKDIHLREGDRFRAASERTTVEVDLKLADAEHPGVSSQPLEFYVENGELKIVGGGTNGYKVVTTESFKADQTTAVRKGQTVVAGAKAPFRVK